MRMKKLEISNEGLLKVDIMELPENCVIVVSKGQAKVSELPEHAETKIITHQGKVKRLRWDEGEDF